MVSDDYIKFREKISEESFIKKNRINKEKSNKEKEKSRNFSFYILIFGDKKF
jgi:hypothetical protein